MRLRSTKIPKDAVHHPVFARVYARMSVAAETRSGMAAIRADLLTGLSGRIIEIGAGNGLNFAHYPPAVSEVVAIEPEWCLRQLALRSALRAGMPVDVVPAAAEALPVKSEAFDGAVASLVLCTVRNVERSLAEILRVLRPGGELRFFEHVRADDRAMATTQQVLDRTVWPLVCGGCHTSRDTLAAIERAGFVVEEYRRVRMPKRGSGSPPPRACWAWPAGRRWWTESSVPLLRLVRERPQCVGRLLLRDLAQKESQAPLAELVGDGPDVGLALLDQPGQVAYLFGRSDDLQPGGDEIAVGDGGGEHRVGVFQCRDMEQQLQECGGPDVRVAVYGAAEDLRLMTGDRGDERAPVDDLRIAGRLVLGDHEQPGKVDPEVQRVPLRSGPNSSAKTDSYCFMKSAAASTKVCPTSPASCLTSSSM